MDRFERISKMEEILDTHEEVLVEFSKALDKFIKSQEDYNRLKEYYSSDEYMKDYDSYEEPDFPKDLKCGVLSEDAVYNLIGENHDLAIKMMEVALKIIKNH